MGCSTSKSVTVSPEIIVEQVLEQKKLTSSQVHNERSLKSQNGPIKNNKHLNVKKKPRNTIDANISSEKPDLINLLNSESTKEADLLLEAVSADETISRKLLLWPGRSVTPCPWRRSEVRGPRRDALVPGRS